MASGSWQQVARMVLTGGCHYHTVAAVGERNLDLIEEALDKKGYLMQD